MQDYDKTNIFARLAFLIGDIYSYFAVSWGHMGWRLRTWGRLSISSWANILHCVGLNYLHSIGRGRRIASAWAIHVFDFISRMIVSLLSTASLFTFSFFHFSFFIIIIMMLNFLIYIAIMQLPPSASLCLQNWKFWNGGQIEILLK